MKERLVKLQYLFLSLAGHFIFNLLVGFVLTRNGGCFYAVG